MSMEWIIIADDLTGACDTGACFARFGFKTFVALKPGSIYSDAEVLVCSTQSRSISERAAVQAVRQVVTNHIVQASRPFIYKKIDSTLRGHPGAELRAVLEVSGEQRAVVSPAFPSQGRLVRSGRLVVHGKPLEETIFYPEVACGSLAHWFNFPPGYRPLDLQEMSGSQDLERTLNQEAGIFGLDVETDGDLDAVAAAGLKAGIRVWCGSAGLARSLASRSAKGERPAEDLPQGAWLVIVGSRHPVALSQVDALEQAGAAVVSLDQILVAPGSGEGQAAIDDVSKRKALQVARWLDQGRTVVLSVRGLPESPGEEHLVASSLARIARWILEDVSKPFSGLGLTGGDTAAAVCGVLGCTWLRLDHEIEPGLALGCMVDGQVAGLRVITKAGGFGQVGSLLRLISSTPRL